MDKIRIYIALLFCQAISFILPVQGQDNTGSDNNWHNPYGGLMANSTNGRWHVMDPFCEKYYDVSPYAYCAGDPVNAVDIDGRKIVDANGNLMLFIDKNGMIHYTKFANNDTHTLTNSLSLSTTGKTMLNKMIKSDINVHFHISDEVEMSEKQLLMVQQSKVI